MPSRPLFLRFGAFMRRLLPIALLLFGVSIPAATSRASAPVMQIGIASYYGHPFHGRKTANGEIFDLERLTAAHRTLPFGTRLRVTNLANGRSVVVRVNDRGPFRKSRILDLSLGAARELGFLERGLTRVRLTGV